MIAVILWLQPFTLGRNGQTATDCHLSAYAKRDNVLGGTLGGSIPFWGLIKGHRHGY
jgi:hypothetical protein